MKENRPRVVARACAVVTALAFFWGTAPAADEHREPLHVRIDRLLDADRIGPAIAPASDEEFLRRVGLDLTGMPPSAGELASFLADRGPEKRARAVDRLLADPLFARHWATTLDVMLMERLQNEQVTDQEWQVYLLDAARKNRPFNELVAELIRADGVDPKHRAPARFYLDRSSEVNRITRDVGRIFFGVDLQCAQCHNHPLVDDYRQTDYQGLLAFFSGGTEVVKARGTRKNASFPEKVAKDMAFDSVFVKDDRHLTGPRLPGGRELDEPVFLPGEEYQPKTDGAAVPVPRHSRRAMLASLATGGSHRVFNENLANRLWAMMMGRGLVHPVDLRHPANPPSHPELMAMLGREIAALKFDVKPFLRELALTRAYQSSIDLPSQATPLSGSFASEMSTLQERTTAIEAAAERDTDAYRKAEKDWHRAESALFPVIAEEEKAVTAYTSAAKADDSAKAAVTAAEAAVAGGRDAARSLEDVAKRTQEVAKKLPKEKELADAARVFATRSAKAATDLTALEKSGIDKVAATRKSGERRTAAAAALDAARARLKQVRESVRGQEAVALEARFKLTESRSSLENHQRRVATLEAYAHWDRVRQQIDAHRREADKLPAALAAARSRLEDQVVVVRARESGARSAEAGRAGAEKARTAADLAHERQRKAAAGVESALVATRAAESLLPDDPALVEAARQIKGRADALRVGLEGFEGRLIEACWTAAQEAVAAEAASASLETAIAERNRREAGVRAAEKRIATAKARGEALRAELAQAADELTGLLGNRFAMAQLKPLTPEQMYWSMLRVTGVYDRTRQAQEADVERAWLVAGAALSHPSTRRFRAVEVEQRTFDKLKSDVRSFVRVYGAGAGQPQNDFFATADQALFASNGGAINGWITPAGGNVTQRLIAENDPRKAARDLYMTVLTRPPTDDEAADVVRILSVPASDRPAAVQELVWGLLTSVEFRFNH